MAAPVFVPHRVHMPTQELRSRENLTVSADESDQSLAQNLCYAEYASYEGTPEAQSDVLATALDDVAFYREAEQARERIQDFTRQSPLFDYDGFTVKDETQQLTHSFKVRGAANFILKRQAVAERVAVITASAGNHGQGVALVSGKLGLRSVIVVPEHTPEKKISAIREFGGEIVIKGQNYQESSEYAQALQAEQGGLYVPAYNHRDVMAGQATIGLELFVQQPDVSEIVVAAGGLGLMAGIARVARVKSPRTRVWGAGQTGANAAAAAFQARRIVKSPIDTFADGIAVNEVGSDTFPHAYRLGAGVLTVSREQLQREVARLDNQGHLAEPAGAVAVAALRYHRDQLGSRPVAVLSGANIDPSMLEACKKAL